jgi:1,4-dihydroxy-2-naphthoyl-CoA hydrolase
MTNTLWKYPVTVETLRNSTGRSMADYLGIEITEIGADYLMATMPATERTVQPFGIIHGGANVVLAETLGSIASTLCIEDLGTHTAVGVEVNANHLKAVPLGGKVTGTCKPVRVGRNIHVWQIDIHDEKGHLTCTSRLTVTVVERKK